jgi:hypothetical protein
MKPRNVVDEALADLEWELGRGSGITGPRGIRRIRKQKAEDSKKEGTHVMASREPGRGLLSAG